MSTIGTLQASHTITKSAGFSPIYYIHVIINTIKQSNDIHVNKNSGQTKDIFS